MINHVLSKVVWISPSFYATIIRQIVTFEEIQQHADLLSKLSQLGV